MVTKNRSKRYTNIMILLFCTALFSCIIPSSLQAAAAGELKFAYQNGNMVEKLNLMIEDTVDLRFLGAPDNWSELNPQWISTDDTVLKVDTSGIVTAYAVGTAYVLLVLDNGMTGLLPVTVIETALLDEISPVPELSENPKNEDKTERKENQVLFKNQEAIHIPSNASFADGTPLQNINDIARYAFSFMLSDGTPIIPTYDGNATGVADIAGVDYRAIEGASSVIVRSIYLKVYLDANNDGWVSAAEKAEDALGYYCIEVKVDKTLTVEDWSIVKQ